MKEASAAEVRAIEEEEEEEEAHRLPLLFSCAAGGWGNKWSHQKQQIICSRLVVAAAVE